MKKLLSFVAVALLGLGTTFAQTAAPAQTAKKTAKKVETKTVAAPGTAKKEVKATTVKTTEATNKAAANGLKKDGTPDMRLKENKAKAVVAGPAKKDGTPDMRYKANKKAAAKKN